MTSYYNEIDDYAAQWLRNLIAAGLIAPGDVDQRDIRSVGADDLRGYAQCHFFAGIGVWSFALRQAGWEDDRPVWTGSCPCQPFSGAGKRLGTADERHLWPVWFDLIRQCRPGFVLGEQVASKDGLGWWDTLSADLENEDYASTAIDLCVPGVGGAHIRQRLYWLAYDHRVACEQRRPIGGRGDHGSHAIEGAGFSRGGELGGVAYSSGIRCNGRGSSCTGNGRDAAWLESERFCDAGGMGNAESQPRRLSDRSNRPSPLNGFWADADWLGCVDGKWRPVEPGTFPLAHRTPSRVGRLRAYGNAIVAPQAIQFIESVMDVLHVHLP